MSGKTHGLTARETRRQMLLLESELNRKLWLTEWAGLRQEIQGLTGGLESLGSLASVAAQVAAVSTGFFQGITPRDPPAAPAKSSWLAALLRGIRLGGVLWSVLRRPRR